MQNQKKEPKQILFAAKLNERKAMVFIPLGTNQKMKGRLQVAVHKKKWLERGIKTFPVSGMGITQ